MYVQFWVREQKFFSGICSVPWSLVPFGTGGELPHDMFFSFLLSFLLVRAGGLAHCCELEEDEKASEMLGPLEATLCKSSVTGPDRTPHLAALSSL